MRFCGCVPLGGVSGVGGKMSEGKGEAKKYLSGGAAMFCLRSFGGWSSRWVLSFFRRPRCGIIDRIGRGRWLGRT